MQRHVFGVVQVDAEVGAPRVNYRETITKRANFDYLHKKQSGGQGQYGRVVGYIEPLPEGTAEKFEYANEIVGNAIPPNYLPSCRKGFEEAINSGMLLLMLFLMPKLHPVSAACICFCHSCVVLYLVLLALCFQPSFLLSHICSARVHAPGFCVKP